MRKIKAGITVLAVLFLSGCATLTVSKGTFTQVELLPKVLLVDEIVLDKGVNLPQEEIIKGKEILYNAFKKELPDYEILLEKPAEGKNYLLAKAKITLIRKKRPQLLVLIGNPFLSGSLCSGELTLYFCQDNLKRTEVFKVYLPKKAIFYSGALRSDYYAYHQFLEKLVQRTAKELTNYGK